MYWGGPSQRDRFLHRFSDLILGSSRIASFLGGQQVAPCFSGTRIATLVRVVEVNSSLGIEHRTTCYTSFDPRAPHLIL